MAPERLAAKLDGPRILSGIRGPSDTLILTRSPDGGQPLQAARLSWQQAGVRQPPTLEVPDDHHAPASV